LAKRKHKILEGWKYPLYYRRMGLEPDTKPNIIKRIIDLLLEEGVPRELIREQSSPTTFLDFYVMIDDPYKPKLVTVNICTMKQEDSWMLSTIFEIPFDRKERSRRYPQHKPAVYYPTWHRI
jgi:hypothetical protein